MNDQKLEPLLNLSLDATARELEKSPGLSAGVSEDVWTLIIKYVGNLNRLYELSITPVILLGGYAIIEVPRSLIPLISDFPEIIYIEKPKNLAFTILNGRRVSCVSAVQTSLSQAGSSGLKLYGEGCIIGIVDSGIDYANPVFLNPDGTSRILGIWDQTVAGTPPAGYQSGTYYDQNRINEALNTPPLQRQSIVQSSDTSGHGTAVASIAAGNFSPNPQASVLGMAAKSDLLIVKLGRLSADFPRTSELMQAVDFLVKKCVELNRPLALNLSFGNNYGSHTGTSLLETYLDIAASTGQTSIIIGTGNEGISDGHTGGMVLENQTIEIPFSIAEYEPAVNIQLWKSFFDKVEITLESPRGDKFTLPSSGSQSYRWSSGNTNLLIYYGEPSPYQIFQEIYFDFIPVNTYLDAGIWNITLRGIDVKNGEYYMWLPVNSALNGSRFLYPSPFSTLTIPSTASKGIAVSAYNGFDFSYAPTSGRGYQESSLFQAFRKPDIAAPGVDILTAAPGGEFMVNSGTSMAAPFVTGAAAMLMEWGIVNKNDSFLYGEKLKAYLISGAKPLAEFNVYPNPYIGWGTLCVSASLPV